MFHTIISMSIHKKIAFIKVNKNKKNKHTRHTNRTEIVAKSQNNAIIRKIIMMK